MGRPTTSKVVNIAFGLLLAVPFGLITTAGSIPLSWGTDGNTTISITTTWDHTRRQAGYYTEPLVDGTGQS